jgi:hypothetical protein
MSTAEFQNSLLNKVEFYTPKKERYTAEHMLNAPRENTVYAVPSTAKVKKVLWICKYFFWIRIRGSIILNLRVWIREAN